MAILVLDGSTGGMGVSVRGATGAAPQAFRRKMQTRIKKEKILFIGMSLFTIKIVEPAFNITHPNPNVFLLLNWIPGNGLPYTSNRSVVKLANKIIYNI
jgi:hypothetical protein